MYMKKTRKYITVLTKYFQKNIDLIYYMAIFTLTKLTLKKSILKGSKIKSLHPEETLYT